jgi:hypothetical protein
MGFRHPPRLQDSHNRRQVHNADFSSSTAAGPPAKDAITNAGSSSLSPSASSFDSGSSSLTDPASAMAVPLSRRGRITLPVDRRVISVDIVSNLAGAESHPVGNAIVQVRAETGSTDANIDHAAVGMVGYSVSDHSFFHSCFLNSRKRAVTMWLKMPNFLFLVDRRVRSR